MNVLEVTNVSKAFGGIVALNGCSLNVAQGQITGLIGPNGSGKTTLFNVITGYEKVDSGAISYAGKTITNATPDAIFGMGVGRTFQLTRIFPRLSVIENMHVAVQRRGVGGCSVAGAAPMSSSAHWNCSISWASRASRVSRRGICHTVKRSC